MRMGYQITAMEARTWICSCFQREYWMFSKLCHTHVLLLALAWAPVCVNAICICQRIMAIRLGYWPIGMFVYGCHKIVMQKIRVVHLRDTSDLVQFSQSTCKQVVPWGGGLPLAFASCMK
uniref:Uncharacterized protein n=1 Tax=Triticum urartu TaxID=4572 RepID=A0A8R7UR90_TRIUA